MKLKYNYTIMCDLKAELKLTPAEREQALRAPHSKVADRTAGVLQNAIFGELRCIAFCNEIR